MKKQVEALQAQHADMQSQLDRERTRTLEARVISHSSHSGGNIADLDVSKMDLSDALREQLEQALKDLSAVQADSASGAALGAVGSGSNGPADGRKSAAKRPPKANLVAVVERSQQLQHKLDQAKVIMRKLYRRNVELEKDLRAAQAAVRTAPADAPPATAGDGMTVIQGPDLTTLEERQGPTGASALTAANYRWCGAPCPPHCLRTRLACPHGVLCPLALCPVAPLSSRSPR